MKIPMLKILYEKTQLSDDSRVTIDAVLAEAGGNEELTKEQTERITALLEAELALSGTVVEAYEDIEKRLEIAIEGLRSEETEEG